MPASKPPSPSMNDSLESLTEQLESLLKKAISQRPPIPATRNPPERRKRCKTARKNAIKATSQRPHLANNLSRMNELREKTLDTHPFLLDFAHFSGQTQPLIELALPERYQIEQRKNRHRHKRKSGIEQQPPRPRILALMIIQLAPCSDAVPSGPKARVIPASYLGPSDRSWSLGWNGPGQRHNAEPRAEQAAEKPHLAKLCNRAQLQSCR